MNIAFRHSDDLLHFLTTSTPGKALLRDAVLPTRWIVEEVLEQNKSSYVLVKAYRDGLIEVFGPRHVRAKIVLLGRSATFPAHEIASDTELHRSLPDHYRQYDYRTYLLAQSLRGSGIPRDEVFSPCFLSSTAKAEPSAKLPSEKTP